MCIICQDTGTIFVKSPTFLNNPEQCPMCVDLNLHMLDKLVMNENPFNGKVIKSIEMSKKCYNALMSLTRVNDNMKYNSPNLLNIPIKIVKGINSWKVIYYKPV